MKLWIKMPRDDRGHFHLRSRVAFGAYRSRYAPEWHASDSVAFWSGESDVPVERTFSRRSDAKRWLLARAAGLAEVPRGASFGTRYGSPQTNAVVPCGPEGMSVPRGWRVVDAYVAVDGQAVVMLERNRRRR